MGTASRTKGKSGSKPGRKPDPSGAEGAGRELAGRPATPAGTAPGPEDTELAARIGEAHRRGVRAGLACLKHFRDAGGLLLRAKERVGHGNFRPWVEGHCAFGLRSAQAYMRIHERWDEVERLVAENAQRDAPSGLAEVLRALAGPSPAGRALAGPTADPPVAIGPDGGPDGSTAGPIPGPAGPPDGMPDRADRRRRVRFASRQDPAAAATPTDPEVADGGREAGAGGGPPPPAMREDEEPGPSGCPGDGRERGPATDPDHDRPQGDPGCAEEGGDGSIPREDVVPPGDTPDPAERTLVEEMIGRVEALDAEMRGPTWSALRRAGDVRPFLADAAACLVLRRALSTAGVPRLTPAGHGRYARFVDFLVAAKPPREWPPCPDCAGPGRTARGRGNCRSCVGDGYRISG